MLMPQGFIVQKRELEDLQRRVAELEKKPAELETKDPEKRKYFRREVVIG